jgi:hypothetical protein
MVEFSRLAEAEIRLHHQHNDGSWGTMELEPGSHHDSTEHDPERQWRDGRIFRCTACDELVKVEALPSDVAPDER